MKINEIPPDLRPLAFARIDEQSKKLREESLAAISEAINFLFLANAGSAVAAIGFIGSAVLVLAASIPAVERTSKARPFRERLTRGIHIYVATPRLRGLLALNLSAAAAGAFVLVNTVVVVRSGYGAGDAQVAYALAAFGGGSMLAALALPRLLDTLSDRSIMVGAGFLLSAVTLLHAAYQFSAGLPAWSGLLAVWGVSGVLYASILTPSGRLLRNSAHAEDRPALFAAQFTLSHLCWLLAYPVAGLAGSALGLPEAMAILGAIALAGAFVAVAVWPADDALVVEHEHADLPADHPHLRDHPARGARHRHVFVIDDEHRVWPTHG